MRLQQPVMLMSGSKRRTAYRGRRHTGRLHQAIALSAPGRRAAPVRHRTNPHPPPGVKAIPAELYFGSTPGKSPITEGVPAPLKNLLVRIVRPRNVAHAHCDGPCGVYDPAAARIGAEAVL